MANEIKKETKKNKHFLKDFKAELKKVIWPTPKQLVNSTVAVLTIVLVTCAIVLVLDLAFESMNKYGIDKIKTIVSEKVDEENNTSNENTGNIENTENNIENNINSEENNIENAIQ